LGRGNGRGFDVFLRETPPSPGPGRRLEAALRALAYDKCH
jgi:hypothetical protein